MAFLFRVFFGMMLCVAVVHGMIGSTTVSPSSVENWSFTASFGRGIPNEPDKEISESAIQSFIEEMMSSSELADGFKIVQTKGIYEKQKENSFDIVVVHNQFQKMLETMENICLQYVQRFKQDSVMLSYHKVQYSFVTDHE